MSYKTDVHKIGEHGAERPAKPHAGQIASEGATNPGHNRSHASGPGTTTNGRINYPKANDVHEIGRRGAARESKPKESQVASMGAHDPGTGRKHEPGEDGNGTVKKGDDTQPDTRGTSAEEQRARLARRMYPSSSGTRFEHKEGY